MGTGAEVAATEQTGSQVLWSSTVQGSAVQGSTGPRLGVSARYELQGNLPVSGQRADGLPTVQEGWYRVFSTLTVIRAAG